jgi:tetratricopeptide (TPR) repeat protein
VSRDISRIIDEWPYDPDSVTARIIHGRDGKKKVQMRVDLGLLQMEVDGRPDGTRPNGYESYLDYLRAKAERLEGLGREFSLSKEDCDELLREGIQYYYRYLSFFHLEEFELAERDTRRNLELFDFVKRYARDDEDVWRFDQYRPYVIMMNTQAKANMACNRKQYRAAIEIVDEGIRNIRRFLREYELDDSEEDCVELLFLKQRRKQIERSMPVDPIEKLKRRLQHAVDREDYESAAKLRDRIKQLEKNASRGRPTGETKAAN